MNTLLRRQLCALLGCLCSFSIRSEASGSSADLIPTAESVIQKYDTHVSLPNEQTESNGEIPIAQKNVEPLVPSIPLSFVQFGRLVFRTTNIRDFEVLTASPKTKNPKPMVLVLDPEIWAYYHLGINRFRGTRFDATDEESDEPEFDFENTPDVPLSENDPDQQQAAEATAEQQANIEDVERFLNQQSKRAKNIKAYQAHYTWASPLGGQLLKNGFQVFIPHPRHLDELRSLEPNDWAYIFYEFGERNGTDKNSIFVLTTREYSDLAFKIGVSSQLNAIILEEPDVPINASEINGVWTPNSDSSPWDVLHENSKFEYIQIVAHIDEKMLIVREQNSTFFDFNNQTLIPSFLDARKPFVVALLNDNPRVRQRIIPFDRIKAHLPLKEAMSYLYEYEEDSMRKWIERSLAFLIENAEVKPLKLPDAERLTVRRPPNIIFKNREAPDSSNGGSAPPPGSGRQ